NAGVDRFNNVLAEICEGLVFKRSLLQRFVKLGILKRHGDVPGEGLQKVDILAGEEVPIARFPQAEVTQGALFHLKWQVIVQVQLLNRLLRRGRETKRAPDTVKKQILPALLAARGVKETCIQSLGVAHAARLDQAELAQIRRPK